jgi:hypothetical protein
MVPKLVLPHKKELISETRKRDSITIQTNNKNFQNYQLKQLFLSDIIVNDC